MEQQSKRDFWYADAHTADYGFYFRIKDVLFSAQSPFQRIDIVETYGLGRMLILDDSVNTTERDEAVYHEMLVHVPLFTHPDPRKVLIIGGGDGGAVREASKHESVREIHLVEIDEVVIEACRQHFPSTAVGLADEKLTLHIEDGVEHVRRSEGRYDVILIDSTDVGGPSEALFTSSFYASCSRALTPEGLLVAQTESPFFNLDLIGPIYANLKSAFPIVRMYLAGVQSYGGLWTFGLASKKYSPIQDFQRERYEQAQLETQYYNDEIHLACFALPNYLKALVE